MTARVSIVVRTKDRPLFLRRALDSIAAQTFPDWEAIIVNDGGDPDRVRALVDRLAAPQRDRVRIVSHEQSQGRWASANAGVRAAEADLLVLHDDDDTWDPGFLAAAVSYLDAHPDREAVVSRIRIVWERRVGDRIETTGVEPFVPESVAPLLMDQVAFNRFVPIGVLYRRRVHDEFGPFDESHPVVADWQFNTRLLARGPVDYLGDEPLVSWHQRPTSAGIDSNSVIGDSAQHRLADALIRDEAFRATYASDPGLVLYLERRLRQVEELIKYEGALTRQYLVDHVDARVRRPFSQRLSALVRRLPWSRR